MRATETAPEGICVILPSLNPSDKFDTVVDEVVRAGFTDVVIIDDGSAEEYKRHFRRAEQYPQVTVLTHEVNRGKGQGLRTAFQFLTEQRPDCRGAVTIDGDGQHLIHDILACANAIEDGTLVMGCRNFDGPEVPKRSRSGNHITCAVFHIFCGIRLSDTQTGLRGIPAALFPDLLQVRGDRYEYETNMLLDLKRQGVKFREVPIETVYEDGNSESHFRPIIDSLKIYKFILLYLFSSIAGALVDQVVFYFSLLLITATPADPASGEKLLAMIVARVCSSFVNFTLNRSVVFHGRDSYGKTILRYYALCVPQMLISWLIVDALSRWAATGASILTTLIKTIVDIILFFISFRIQQNWVFRNGKRNS